MILFNKVLLIIFGGEGGGGGGGTKPQRYVPTQRV